METSPLPPNLNGKCWKSQLRCLAKQLSTFWRRQKNTTVACHRVPGINCSTGPVWRQKPPFLVLLRRTAVCLTVVMSNVTSLTGRNKNRLLMSSSAKNDFCCRLSKKSLLMMFGTSQNNRGMYIYPCGTPRTAGGGVYLIKAGIFLKSKAAVPTKVFMALICSPTFWRMRDKSF